MVHGATLIKIQISSHGFEFKTSIVKNVSCHKIIENYFHLKITL